MSRRSRAREVVLQLLYRDDLNENLGGDTASSSESREVRDTQFLTVRLQGNRELVRFADSLLLGIRQHQEEIDRMLSEISDNWQLNRMAATDRNILRLGVFEMIFLKTPARVAINEAIELSKRYGDQNSPRFINGLLDRLLQVDARAKNEKVDDQETPQDN